MFRDVPECSGMFRVAGFIDAQSTLLAEFNTPKIGPDLRLSSSLYYEV